MHNQSKNIELIKIIATGLGQDLLEKVIFVGGSVVGLYSTKISAQDVRFTEDIDCIISLASKKDFNNLESIIRKKGFENDIRKAAPICRWVYQDITVDIMPDDPKILGFSNTWYKAGVNSTISSSVSNGIVIKILSPEYFIASKLEAHFNRGGLDIRFSTDFSDIVYLLNNRPEISDEVLNTDVPVKNFIIDSFKKLLSDVSIEEAIEVSLPRGLKVNKIIDIMNKITNTV